MISNDNWSSVYGIGADRTENTISNRYSIVAYLNVTAITWCSLSHCQARDVFTAPIPSYTGSAGFTILALSKYATILSITGERTDQSTGDFWDSTSSRSRHLSFKCFPLVLSSYHSILHMLYINRLERESTYLYVCRILGSHSGDYEEFHCLEYNAVQSGGKQLWTDYMWLQSRIYLELVYVYVIFKWVLNFFINVKHFWQRWFPLYRKMYAKLPNKYFYQ
jgi:hypothetical protein